MSWPPRFLFHSGRPSLDFAHTGGLGRRAIWERLRRPQDLSDWFQACGLSVPRVSVEPADLFAARRLRESIWWSAQAVRRGLAPPPGRLAELNRFAAEPDLAPVLGPGGPDWAAGASPAMVLSTLARDAIQLYGSDSRHRVRECASPHCPLLFVDTSRPGRRTWCCMQRCGNLAKTRRYRRLRRV